MTLTCTVCASPEWMAVAPGTAPDASRFLQYNLFELHPAKPVNAAAWCAEHWRQGWTSALDAQPNGGTNG